MRGNQAAATLPIAYHGQMVLSGRRLCHWVRCKGLFAPPGQQFGVRDVWQMKDGDYLTITNRWQDLPPWFDLHPLECSGALCDWMQKKLREGYEPEEPVEGPNIWRLSAGDRLAWVGPFPARHSTPRMACWVLSTFGQMLSWWESHSIFQAAFQPSVASNRIGNPWKQLSFAVTAGLQRAVLENLGFSQVANGALAPKHDFVLSC